MPALECNGATIVLKQFTTPLCVMLAAEHMSDWYIDTISL